MRNPEVGLQYVPKVRLRYVLKSDSTPTRLRLESGSSQARGRLKSGSSQAVARLVMIGQPPNKRLAMAPATASDTSRSKCSVSDGDGSKRWAHKCDWSPVRIKW